MVRTGAAFVFYEYLRDCDQAAYIAAEQQAQRFRQGVWRWDGGTERPWDFRSRRRNPGRGLIGGHAGEAVLCLFL
jgi:endonuclease YncB( thermonuclease family)